MIIFSILIFLITMLLGFPIAFVIGFTTFSYMLLTGNIELTLISQRLFVGLDNFIFLAVPFFILTANLMTSADITKKLVDFANSLVGHMAGGLAQVNVVVSMFFAGITGAGTADTAAIGSLLIPAMVKDGYTPAYSAAVTAASSVIGAIIPPSIAAIFYAVVAGQSVAAVLLAGAIPGILIGFAEMLVVKYHANKYNFPVGKKSSLKEIGKAFKDAVPVLTIPVVIIGGILSGIFTPTEAAAICVAISFFLGTVFYKSIKLSQIPKILLETTVTIGSLMLVFAMASSFAWVLTIAQIPQKVTYSLAGLTKNPYLILLIINILLLFIGTFMETIVAIIIMTPILLPVVTKIGINPIHFGAIMIVNLNIGLITPPLGLCLFVAAQISKTSIDDIVKDIGGFFIALIAILFLVTYIEPLSMFLPNLLLK